VLHVTVMSACRQAVLKHTHTRLLLPLTLFFFCLSPSSSSAAHPLLLLPLTLFFFCFSPFSSSAFHCARVRRHPSLRDLHSLHLVSHAHTLSHNMLICAGMCAQASFVEGFAQSTPCFACTHTLTQYAYMCGYVCTGILR